MANTNSSLKRHWTPYELNQLARAGLTHLAETVTTEIPVEYLTGQVDFCGWLVKVSTAVLVPRIETEQLVDLAMKFVLANSKPLIQIVEVGTGSGAIGLSLWRNLVNHQPSKKFKLNLLEVSQSAIKVAAKNLQTLKAEFNLSPKLTYPEIQLSDLLAVWPINQPIDLLIANLPYIPTAKLKSLPQSVIDFEPKLALDGGPDGLRLINELLLQAKTRLAPGGLALLEVDESQTLDQFSNMRSEYEFESVADCFGKARFITANLKV